MKAEYEVTVKIKGVYDIDTLNNLKSNTEFAEDLARLVCDEIATAGGVGTYEVLETRFNVSDIKCKLECEEKGNCCCCECLARLECDFACDNNPANCMNVCN